MIIRKERVGDVPRIHQLTRDAFLNAPHTDHTEQFIVDALRSAGALSISLVAERAGEVLGHVAVSLVTISDGTTGWFGLGPVSVAPAEQGAGIGSALMQAALAELKQLGARGCVLLGAPAFYRRFGFRPAAPLVLTDVPPEYFQAVLFAGELPRGEVSYHPAFAARV
ncbi:MAG TPA: GNAT family N-acetyltransferase [Pseudomonas sp.]|nr:GNAT family N-acetyltransferase [Pseudomonas sp.]MAQ51489.1 GNAT family N-acetyltransferase [Pseudomonas sp.]HCA23934.1 GNAT family N-acetyltransferase [Pseudomonas sp.]|tara:strand:+ start:2584 stop:3084 length:501 start_codon:yes stop_codon:yes gene_type:complete